MDFTFENHGSIVLCRPQNEAAAEHLLNNVGSESPWFGDALAVEPRYVAGLIEGLRDNGWSV